MKKLMIIVWIATFATLSSTLVQASVKEELKGIWEYKVAGAPEEYNAGKLIFSELEGKTTGTVKLMDGNEIKIQEITFTENSFSFSVTIDYNQVKITGKIVQGKMSGKVDSPEGLLDLVAERPKVIVR